MAYKGTDSETGEQFTGGKPSKEEKNLGDTPEDECGEGGVNEDYDYDVYDL